MSRSKAPVLLETSPLLGPTKPRSSRSVARQDLDDSQSSDAASTFHKVAAFLSVFLVVLFFPLSLLLSLQIVKQYERVVVLRLGCLTSHKARGPGLVFFLPCIDSVRTVDLRIVTYNVPPLIVLTRDCMTALVDAVVYFHIQDPVSSVLQAENARNSTHKIAQGILRDVLGTKSLAQILSDREEMNENMKILMNSSTETWGIEVCRVELKDVVLPEEMQRSIAVEAEAEREAKAKLITAEGEQRAARKLREAADIMDESPATLQLRYLQTLNSISAENNHTYVFPLPLELIKNTTAR